MKPLVKLFKKQCKGDPHAVFLQSSFSQFKATNKRFAIWLDSNGSHLTLRLINLFVNCDSAHPVSRTTSLDIIFYLLWIMKNRNPSQNQQDKTIRFHRLTHGVGNRLQKLLKINQQKSQYSRLPRPTATDCDDMVTFNFRLFSKGSSH